jgi:Na+/proline symporter
MNQEMMFAVFGGTLLLFLSISVMFRQPAGTIQQYYWGGNSLSVGNVASLILSNSFSMNGLLYQVWLGFLIGWWSLAIQAIWCAGFFILIYRSSSINGEVGRGTIHFAIERYFGRRAGSIAAIASTIGFAGLIGWESVVGATFLKNAAHGASGISNSLYIVLPLLLALVASFYTRNGGLKGNGTLNLMQNGLKMAALIAAAAYLLVTSPMGFGVLSKSNSANIGLGTAVVAIGGGVALFVNGLFSFLWQSVDMSVWQNLAAVNAGTDEQKSSRKRSALKWAAGAAFVFPGVVGSVIGIAISGLPLPSGAAVTDNNILNIFLGAVSQVPLFGILLVACFASAMLSTIDGYSLASAQAITWDITNKKSVRALLDRKPPYKPSYEDERVINIGRLWVFFVAVGGAAIMMYLVFALGVNLFTLVYAVVVGQMSLVGPVMSILLYKHSSEVVWMGWLPVASGLVAGLGCLVCGLWLIPAAFSFAPLITVMASLLVTVICSVVNHTKQSTK